MLSDSPYGFAGGGTLDRITGCGAVKEEREVRGSKFPPMLVQLDEVEVSGPLFLSQDGLS